MRDDVREREIRERLEAATPGPHLRSSEERWREWVEADTEFRNAAPSDLRYLLSALDAARQERDAAVAALTERESALARIDELFARTEEVRTGLQSLRDEYTLSLERRVQAMRERAERGAVDERRTT